MSFFTVKEILDSCVWMMKYTSCVVVELKCTKLQLSEGKPLPPTSYIATHFHVIACKCIVYWPWEASLIIAYIMVNNSQQINDITHKHNNM